MGKVLQFPRRDRPEAHDQYMNNDHSSPWGFQPLFPSGPGRRWTAKQDAYISELWSSGQPQFGLRQLAEAVGRTEAAVQQRLHRLGVKRPSPREVAERRAKRAEELRRRIDAQKIKAFPGPAAGGT